MEFFLSYREEEGSVLSVRGSFLLKEGLDGYSRSMGLGSKVCFEDTPT
jgi:hypothetical protein